MKKLVVLLSLIATASAFSQGQVAFNNKVSSTTPPIDAPISYGDNGAGVAGPVAIGAKPNRTISITDGTLVYGGINAMAALYGGAPGAQDSALTILVPAVPFRSTAATAGYVDATFGGVSSTRTITGIDVGQAATFQIRAWDVGTSGVLTFEDAVAKGVGYWGKSANINIASLGGGSVAPSQLIGAAAFSMVYHVPEPSIIGLGILGAVAGLVAFRRRN